MQEGDLAEVLAIERHSFSPWSAGSFSDELHLDLSRVLLARAGGDECGGLAGFVCFRLVADEAQILNLAVAPRLRRRGVGRALVRRVVSEAEAAAARVVGLEVRDDNVAALALYSSCGFATVGRRDDYYGLGRDAILMDLGIGSRLS